MNYINIPIEGISVSETSEVIHIQSASPLTTLSSAIVGSGFQHVRHILNTHVDKNYAASNPKADLRVLARRQNIREPFIGLLTAVHLRKLRAAFVEADGLSVGSLITAGVGNATCAGVTPPFSYQPGTINIILLLDAHLTRGAMLNAFITVTEAKCIVLQSRNIRTPDDDPATGTSTDTITIAATGRGSLNSYAGPATPVGWLIARAVRRALEDSLSAS